MARARGFRVVVATDGSADGRAAVAVAGAFPWPPRARARGVVARFYPAAAGEWSAAVWATVEKSSDSVAAGALRALRHRWPHADVVIRDRPPVEAILTEARGASAIVVGSRGHGVLGRLVLGSVSRGVVRGAACSTLVVRARPRAVRRFLVGLDGSANARGAVAFVRRLRPPRGGFVMLVRVLEPVRLPSMELMPAGVRDVLRGEMAAVRAQQMRAVRREQAAAAALLKRGGWRVRSVIRWGRPVDELLAVGRSAHAHVLVVGARGRGGVARLLLGSVAEGVLSGSPGPVLVVR
jgi:nucleotide-binding universal stress UspA family protein